MKISKKKLNKAKYYIENPHELDDMKKYLLVDLIREYGITIKRNSYVEKDTLIKVCIIVLKDVIEKAEV